MRIFSAGPGVTPDEIQDLIDAIAEAETLLDAIEAAGDTQVARVALAPGSTMYANTTAGLAGTTSGSYFVVPVATGFQYYLDNAGVAVSQGIVPNTVELAAAVTRDTPELGYADLNLDSELYHAIDDGDGVPILGLGRGFGYQVPAFLATQNGWARVNAEVEADNLLTEDETVVIPATRIKTASGYLDVQAAGAAFAVPGTIVKAADTSIGNLVYQSDSYVICQRIVAGTFVLTRTAGGAALVEDVDYSVDYETGTVTGLVNVAEFDVTAAYTAYLQRVDYVIATIGVEANGFEDPSVGTFSVVEGTPYARAAAMWGPEIQDTAADPTGSALAARMAIINAGYLAYKAFVYRTSDGTTNVDLVPTHRFKDRAKVGHEGEYSAYIMRNRSRMPRFLSKIAQNEPVVIGITGDSIGQVGGLSADDSYLYPNTTPLGGYRDTIGYYTLYDTATRALIPKYTDTGDFGGGGRNDHVKDSASWQLVTYLRSLGMTVTHQNWSIAGTSCADGVNARDEPNLGNSIRLDAMANYVTQPDLWIINDGMNDLTVNSVATQACTIIDALKTDDNDLIWLTPVRRFPGYIGGPAYAQWMRVCNELSLACSKKGVPCVESPYAYSRENLGALGMSQYQLCDSTDINHPGYREFIDAVGPLLIDHFKGL